MLVIVGGFTLAYIAVCGVVSFREEGGVFATAQRYAPTLIPIASVYFVDDLVISIFGAMFAPRPFDVAKEVVRVARPGGRIVMGIPNDPTLVAQILKISSSYSPPPPEGFVSPMTWGVEDNVIERFASAGVPEATISFERDTYTFNFPNAPSELVDVFRAYYGPTMNAFEAAAATGREANLKAETGRSLQRPEHKPERGCHLHSCNLPPRDGRGVRSQS